MSIQSLLKSSVAALAIAGAGAASARARPSMPRRSMRWWRRAPSPAPRPSQPAPGPARSSRPARCAWAAPRPRTCSRCSTEKDGKLRGFDAGLAQLITRYILGDASKVQFTQVNSSTREQVLINGQVDMVVATYSITPARAEKISFAGPYYTSQAGVLVKASNQAIQSVNDLGGRKVATQAGSTGPAILAQFAPKSTVQEFQTHQEALDALRQGRVAAYVTDHTLLLNTLSLGTADAKLAGAPFGAQDPYGIGLPKGSDGVAFVNAFLKKIEADGTWAKLWTIAIGQRTGSTAVPTPPALP